MNRVRTIEVGSTQSLIPTEGEFRLRKKIGECLIQAGLITEDDLQIALAEHKRTGERVGVVLVRMNLATEKQIAKALALSARISVRQPGREPARSRRPSSSIPKDVALKRVCVAVKLEKNLLTVAMSDPLLFSLVQDLEFQTGYRIKQVVATRGDILEAIEIGYPDKALAQIHRRTERPGGAAGSPPKPRRGRASSARPRDAARWRDVFEEEVVRAGRRR